MLAKVKSYFEEEQMQTHDSVLGYRIDLYFHDYKLATETDENGHSEKNIDYEIKRQKTMKQELGCEFIRIDLPKKTLIFLKLFLKYSGTLNNFLIIN